MITRGSIVVIVIAVLVLLSVGLGVGLTWSRSSGSSSNFNGLGVCYDTGLLQDASEMKECIGNDFQRIKDAGFEVVRTYFPKYGYASCGNNNIGLYGELAQLTGLKLMLGVNPQDYETYKVCIMRQLEMFSDQIESICVGNENVQDGNWGMADEIINVAQDIKSHYPNVKVGTAQQSGFGVCAFAGVCTALCGSECQAAYVKLYESLDFMGFNVYPGSRGGPAIATQDADYNEESTRVQFELLRENVSNVMITESGMPHAGQCYDKEGKLQTYSRSLQSKLNDFIRNWSSQTNVRTFVFMAFDVPSKPNAPGCAPYESGEKTFGVIATQSCPRVS